MSNPHSTGERPSVTCQTTMKRAKKWFRPRRGTMAIANRLLAAECRALSNPNGTMNVSTNGMRGVQIRAAMRNQPPATKTPASMMKPKAGLLPWRSKRRPPNQ